MKQSKNTKMRDKIIDEAVEELMKYLSTNGPLSELDKAIIKIVITQVYLDAQYEMLEQSQKRLKKLL